MRCQACHTNEADTLVICDGCVLHYNSIREGAFTEHDLELAGASLRVRSWIAVASSAVKKAGRDAKAAKVKKGGGIFGRKKEAPAEEEPPPPPPDWKNRVFPAESAAPEQPDAMLDRDAGAAAAAAAYEGTGSLMPYGDEPVEAEAKVELDLTPESDLEIHEPIHVDPETAFAEPAPIALDLGATDSHETMETTIPAAAEPEAPAPVVEPPPELASFLEGLGSTPAAPPEEPAAAPEPLAADLSSFFDSLATPQAPAPETEPAPPATPEAPAQAPSADLADFFSSLSAPAAPAPEAEPPVGEATTPAAEPTVAEPAAPTVAEPAATEPPAAEPSAAAPELSSFFESLSQPAAEPFVTPAEEPFIAPAEAPPIAPAPPAPPAPSGGIDLTDFFTSLQQPPGASAAPAPLPPVEPPPAPPEPPASRGGKPFTIDLGDIKPAAGGEGKKAYEIDLSAPAPRHASTGGLSFEVTRDEDEDDADGGLLDGLSFTPDPDAASHLSDASHRAARPDDDDEDDTKTIEL